VIITIRIAGEIDRIIESSKINLDKKKKVDSVVPISAVRNKFNNGRNDSDAKREEFSKYFEEEIQKRKKRWILYEYYVKIIHNLMVINL